MKKSSIQDQAELCSSIGLEMTAKNVEEGHGSFTKIFDLAMNRVLLRFMSMSMSFFMGNFHLSNNKTSSNSLHKNTLEFLPSATVEL